MKRTILSIIIVAVSLCNLMAQNDAMYIYRNDGVINAFLKADVDSIRHSKIDMDSSLCKEFVVQEVWTTDSVYRIPFSAIDSVSFITPPTVYKNDVIKIEENLLTYVVGVDSLTLKLRADTPSYIIPKAGKKLVLLNGCDVLPNGFSGVVSKIETISSDGLINVVCKQAYIEDLFDSFCSVSTTYGDANGTLKTSNVSNGGIQRSVYNPNDFIFKFGPFTKNCTKEIGLGTAFDGNLALKGGTNSSVTIQPSFRIHTFLIFGEVHGTYFNCSITGNIEVTSEESVYGGIDYSHDFLNKEYRYPIPQTANLVNFYIMPGLFFRANAVITASIKDTRNYSFGMAFDYSSIRGNLTTPSLGGRLSAYSTEMEGCIDGSIAAGAFIETGFNLASRDIAKVCVRGEYGYQLSGNFVLRKADVEDAQKETKLYERLKGCSIEFGPFANASLQASVATVGIGKTWELSEISEKRNIVPIFANTNLTYVPSNSVLAFTEVSGRCFLPIIIGYKLFDDIGNEVVNYSEKANYSDKKNNLSHTFTGLIKNKYTVYPTVKIFGYDFLATPKCNIDIAKSKITGFKIINSNYSKSSFTIEGKTYDYKFDVAVIAKINNIDGVEDWGYICKEPDGNINRFSLMQCGTSYIDTRHSYYRNEAKSKICLIGYVRYENDTIIYESEPFEYNLEYSNIIMTCPDNNHPHAIDLGLPSGTKWACCNVGATNPEEYGGYYAWGETKEKDIYGRNTYAWYDNNYNFFYDISSYVYIGKDIKGTQYDVAYINMGDSWNMPSYEQNDELLKNCTQVLTQLNGVNGCLVIGSNGNEIFLPAAGLSYYDVVWGIAPTYEGTRGFYWSSALVIDWISGAYALTFNPLHIMVPDRSMGCSVRAVCH